MTFLCMVQNTTDATLSAEPLSSQHYVGKFQVW